jgi:phosphoribosyl 1,2-cyclic phosphodiesterase
MVAKPKLLIVTHLGMKFLQAGKEEQRKLIEEETGVQTILAAEGLKLDLEGDFKQRKLT